MRNKWLAVKEKLLIQNCMTEGLIYVIFFLILNVLNFINRKFY